MPEINRVFLDATPIIYYVQQNEHFFEKVRRIFVFLNENYFDFIASDVVTAEARVHAYRYNKTDWLNNFDNLMNLLNVKIIHTSEEIAIKTSQIRAKYKSFETPDAFNLATAVLSDCEIFLTNDKRLRQFDA